MTTDVFIRSYVGDIKWVPFCLRGIQKFLSGYRNTIIVVPKDEVPIFARLGLSKERVLPSYYAQKDGYMDQQVDKLMAYRYSDADAFLFMDSDCICTRPFTPKDLCPEMEYQPRCLYTPYESLKNQDGSPATPWQSITTKALQTPVAHEFMRQHPFLLPRQAMIDFEQFMWDKHHLHVWDYIRNQPGREFSEFNAIHAWAYYFSPLLFHWINTDEKGAPEPFVWQGWSWGGITPQIEAHIEKLLA